MDSVAKHKGSARMTKKEILEALRRKVEQANGRLVLDPGDDKFPPLVIVGHGGDKKE